MNFSSSIVGTLFVSFAIAGCAVQAGPEEGTAEEAASVAAASHHGSHHHADAGAACGVATCAEATTADGRLLAKNFGSESDARAWAQTNAGSAGTFALTQGTCDVVAHQTMCSMIYKPVCGVSVDGAKTYGSACTYRAAVLTAAGASGEAAAKAIAGACADADAGTTACATYTLEPASASQHTYYASNWNSAEEANAFLSLTKTAESNVLAGSCSTFKICNKLYMPVCGAVRDEAVRTFGNRCELEAAVRTSAGVDSASKGYFRAGACPVAGN